MTATATIDGRRVGVGAGDTILSAARPRLIPGSGPRCCTAGFPTGLLWK